MGIYKSKNVKHRTKLTVGDWFLIALLIVLGTVVTIGSALLGRILANV